MFNKNYLLNIILLFLCFPQNTNASNNETTEFPSTISENTTIELTTIEMTTLESTTSQSSTVMGSTTIPTSLTSKEITTGSSAGVESTITSTGSSASVESTITSTGSSASVESTITSTGSSASVESTITSTGSSASVESTITSTGSSASVESTITSTGTGSSTTESTAISSSMTTSLSNTGSTTSYTSIMSTSIPSTMITSSPMIASINISRTYRYGISSTVALQTGIINNSNVTNTVQTMVNSSFNLTNFKITVLQIEVLNSTAKSDPYNYNMLVGILFTSFRSDCNETCIDNATVLPTMNFTLPDTNNMVVNVYATSAPSLEPNITPPTTTTVNLPTGGPSPGIPAQLGMGIGISLIGVLLIAEVIFLYWKCGLSNSPRRQAYSMTHFQ